MLRSTLLFLVLPIGGLFAQNQSVHLVISAPNQAQFWVVRPSSDSGRGPVFGRGRLELVADLDEKQRAIQAIEVGTLDTLNKVHVDATQNGRVIASGDGAYVIVHRDASGVALDIRSQLPPSVAREHVRRD